MFRFDGTLFRFPLRKLSHGSELCPRTKYSPSKVLDMFKDMRKDGHLFLLFLKNVENIEIYHKK